MERRVGRRSRERASETVQRPPSGWATATVLRDLGRKSPGRTEGEPAGGFFHRLPVTVPRDGSPRCAGLEGATREGVCGSGAGRGEAARGRESGKGGWVNAHCRKPHRQPRGSRHRNVSSPECSFCPCLGGHRGLWAEEGRWRSRRSPIYSRRPPAL